MSGKASFLAELKRRNVFRAAALYAAGAWLLVQVATQVFALFHVAEWVMHWIVVAAIVGFPFAMLFSWFYEWTSQGLQLESEVPPNESITRQTGRRLDRWIIAVLALAIVLLLSNQFVHRDPNSIARAKVPEKSIAVLPMVNSTGDPAQEYFSDGISEEFISSLSRLHDLKVIGRTSSFQFKGKADDSKTIGDKLGVYYLLEGSVRKSANRVRIAVELVKAADGADVCSDSYDREMKDIFAVQSEIAGAVAKHLRVTLLGHAETAKLATAAMASNQNVEAHNALLQGNFYAEGHTAGDFRKAIGYYKKAIQLDPRYALAYAHLSIISSNLVFDFGRVASKEGQKKIVAKAREAANTALRLDPNLSEAHLAKGTFLRMIGLDYAAAEKECRRAPELAPKSPGALFLRTYALALAEFAHGDHAQADVQLKKLLDEDAEDGGSQIATIYAQRKEPDKAFAWLEHAWTSTTPASVRSC